MPFDPAGLVRGFAGARQASEALAPGILSGLREQREGRLLDEQLREAERKRDRLRALRGFTSDIIDIADNMAPGQQYPEAGTMVKLLQKYPDLTPKDIMDANLDTFFDPTGEKMLRLEEVKANSQAAGLKLKKLERDEQEAIDEAPVKKAERAAAMAKAKVEKLEAEAEIRFIENGGLRRTKNAELRRAEALAEVAEQDLAKAKRDALNESIEIRNDSEAEFLELVEMYRKLKAEQFDMAQAIQAAEAKGEKDGAKAWRQKRGYNDRVMKMIQDPEAAVRDKAGKLIAGPGINLMGDVYRGASAAYKPILDSLMMMIQDKARGLDYGDPYIPETLLPGVVGAALPAVPGRPDITPFPVPVEPQLPSGMTDTYFGGKGALTVIDGEYHYQPKPKKEKASDASR